MQAADFEVAVSSENSHYLAWQTLAFCYSCLSRLGIAPTVIVHPTGIPLRPEFIEVEAWGCRIVQAPSFRTHPIGDFPPRNEPGSLLSLAQAGGLRKPFLLFCEADMLFTGYLRYPATLCGQRYDYLDYGNRRVHRVTEKLGIRISDKALNTEYGLGVPYLLPTEFLLPLSSAWIRILDMFDQIEWIDIMYAFGLALASLDHHPTLMTVMTDNLAGGGAPHAPVIHYCYPDNIWDKRFFSDINSPLDEPEEARDVFARKSIQVIRRQMAEAQAFRSERAWVQSLRKNAWRLKSRLHFFQAGLLMSDRG